MKKGYSTKSTFSITGSAGIPVKAVEVGLEAGFTKKTHYLPQYLEVFRRGKQVYFKLDINIKHIK